MKCVKNPISIDDLLHLMVSLRDQENGCPWDKEQDFASIVPYTIEEAYEVADAIDRGDMADLKDELGDLLFQVVFHAQLAKEIGYFNFQDVVETVVDKMTRRHPHVFSDSEVVGAEQQTEAWEVHKAGERQRKSNSQTVSELSGVALGLPSLLRAQKLQKRAARVGFDWPSVEGVLAKVREELTELCDELEQGTPQSVEEELGDLLFSCVNLSRHMGVDAEQALRRANGKFERRFHALEELVRGQLKRMANMDIDELEAVWQQVKRSEIQ